MSKVLFDKRILKERGLVIIGFCLPYNPQLIPWSDTVQKLPDVMEFDEVCKTIMAEYQKWKTDYDF